MPHLQHAPAEARLDNCIARPGDDGNEYAAAPGCREPAVGDKSVPHYGFPEDVRLRFVRCEPAPARSGKSFLSRPPNERGRLEHNLHCVLVDGTGCATR